MKALPPSSDIHEQFLAVRLYRDDLERVLGYLAHAGLNVRISDERFEYDSIEDLSRAAGQSPKTLTIVGRKQDRLERVSLSRSGRYWYVYANGASVSGVAREIEELVRQRQSRVHALPLFWLLMAGNVVIWTSLIFRGRVATVANALYVIGATLFVGATLLGGYWFLYAGLVLSYPHQAGFFARNRDAILLLIGGAVIGGVVQFAVSRLLGRG